MPYDYEAMVWRCPAEGCDAQFANGGKSKEKYINHLEGHIDD